MSKFNEYLEAAKIFDFPYHVNPKCRYCKHLDRMEEDDNIKYDCGAPKDEEAECPIRSTYKDGKIIEEGDDE